MVYFEYIKGCYKKNHTVDIILNNFKGFQYFAMIFNGDLGFEVGKYHVKFRNDISMHYKEILV